MQKSPDVKALSRRKAGNESKGLRAKKALKRAKEKLVVCRVLAIFLPAFWQKMKGEGKSKGHCCGLGTRTGRQEKCAVRNTEIKIWAC